MNFLYADSILLPDFQEFCKQMLKHWSKERRKMDEAAKLNKMKHMSKKSVCCAPNSENYEVLNRGIHPKNSRKLQLENLLLMKEEILNPDSHTENWKSKEPKKLCTLRKGWEDSIKRI